MLLVAVLAGCSHTFKATLVPDGKPQDVKCVVKPDTSEISPTSAGKTVEEDIRLFQSDLTQFLFNPAAQLHCDY